MKKNVVKTSAVFLVIAALTFSCASGGGGGAAVEQAPPSAKYSWDFDNSASGTAGWVMIPDEYWDFHGTAELSRDDKTFGKAMLRLDVDYSKDAASEWSEPKMKMQFDPPIQDTRRIVFDIIFKKELTKGGHFKSKVIILNGKRELSANNTEAIIARDELPDGYVKGTVTISARSTQPVDNVVLSIAGYKTSYKGPIFFDNMRFE
jgi:mannan endo-1,4-beta-mannosidase